MLNELKQAKRGSKRGLIAVCVLQVDLEDCGEGETNFTSLLNLFYVPGAGCQMPTPHTHLQGRAGACECVYDLQSLDSKEQEMFFLLLSPSLTHAHTQFGFSITVRTHSMTQCIPELLPLSLTLKQRLSPQKVR